MMNGLLMCLFDDAIQAVAALEVVVARADWFGSPEHRDIRRMLEKLVEIQEGNRE